jgi:glycosyltransferase involved in cell wall biosynthesis
MDQQPFLSVVVISWNQVGFLKRLVNQLIDQDCPRDRYEIIVVDDGSTDGSREWLRSLPAGAVRTIFGSGNRGRAASRNAGIRAARGDVVVMLDGDHTVERSFLAIHAERHTEERCVIVGKSNFVDHPDFRALNHYLNRGGADKLPSDAKLPGRYFLTRNCSVPRDLLMEVGLFDEGFSAWGGEDLDLGVRLESSGVPIYGEPRCPAIHHHLRPLNALLRNLFVYGRDCVPLLLDRHPQLFRELNLHRVLPEPGQGSKISQWIYRAVMLAPVYHSVRLTANLLRRRHLPRFVFDYLHLRQYSAGYRASLRSK